MDISLVNPKVSWWIWKSVKGRLVKGISTVINSMRIHNREIQLGQRGYRSLPWANYDWNEFVKKHKNKGRESGDWVCRKSKCKGPVEGWVYSRFRKLREGECSRIPQNVNYGCEAWRSQEEKTWKALWVMSGFCFFQWEWGTLPKILSWKNDVIRFKFIKITLAAVEGNKSDLKGQHSPGKRCCKSSRTVRVNVKRILRTWWQSRYGGRVMIDQEWHNFWLVKLGAWCFYSLNSSLKLYYKPIVTQKSMVLAEKHTHKSMEKIREPRNRSMCFQLIYFWQWAKNIQRGKKNLFNKWCWGKLDRHMPDNQPGLLSYTIQKEDAQMPLGTGKYVTHYSSLGRCKPKPQWSITSHLLEWLLLKKKNNNKK